MPRQEVQNARSSTYKIDLLSLNRWSPRYRSGEQRVAEDLMILLKAARRGIIKPVVPNRFNLNQATEALQMLKDGKTVGGGVINP